jgi:hypothetical protein
VTIRRVGEVVFRETRLSVALLVIRGLVDVRSFGQPMSMGGGERVERGSDDRARARAAAYF